MRRGIVDDGYGRIASAVVKPYSEKTALMEDEYAQDLAEKLVGNWQKFESFGWHDQPEENPENWTIVNTHHRDSGLLDQANAQAIEKIMSEFPDDQVRPEHAGHWAVGWVDGYSIRVYEPDGSLTPAFTAWAGIQLALENYPILDESLYSEMEYEASLKNCAQAVGHYMNSHADERVQDFYTDADDEELGAEFYRWASDSGIDTSSSDDQGYYPDDSDIEEWVQEVIVPKLRAWEPGEEGYEEPDPLAEGFATGPNPVDPRQTSLPFKGGRRRAQAAPQLPTDEEELNPEDMEEMAPTPEQQGLEKFDWNSYIWGPFRKKPGLRLRAQMSTQDDAIIRMVEQEDARLVKYRGGLALVPVDGYAYPVDAAGAELALAHGAEDYTQPKQRAGAREAGMYKGVSDEGLERLAKVFQAQSDPGVSPTGPLPGDEELEDAESEGEAQERGEVISPEQAMAKAKDLWDEDTAAHLVSAQGHKDYEGWSIEAEVFVPREEMADFLQTDLTFAEAPSLEEWKEALYEAYDDHPGIEGNPGRWVHTCSVSSVIEESNGIRFTLTYSAFMDV